MSDDERLTTPASPATTLSAPRVVVSGTARIDYPPESGLPPREFAFTSAPLEAARVNAAAAGEPEPEPDAAPEASA